MIDNFALLVSHVLLMLTAWKLLGRADLDHDDETDAPPRGFVGRRERPPRA